MIIPINKPSNILTSFICLLFFMCIHGSNGWSQRTNGNERRIGIGLDYAFATKAVMPSFNLSTGGFILGKSPLAASLFFKASAGYEVGYYTGNTKSSQIQSYMTSNMSGDELISYNYTGLGSGFVASISIIPTLIIPTEVTHSERKRTIKKWIYFGVGLQITNHTKTIGNYTVVSRDYEYEYTGLEDYEFHPRFFDFSPTVILYGRTVGISYSMQSVFDKSKPNHTIGFTYLLQI